MKGEDYGYYLRTGNRKTIYKFCKLIEPYIIDCFKYKIRCLEDEKWISKINK